MRKQVYAAFDGDGVYVYQAFKPSIVQAALRHGTFADGFNLERMTWIKPSFGWMLYRSGYATKHRQEGILKIKLRHEGFRTILGRAVPTTYDPVLYPSPEEWGSALRRSEVRCQWDPDRDLHLVRMDRRTIQLGLSGETVVQYVREWIMALEDATPLARSAQIAVEQRRQPPAVPEEQVYPLDADLKRRLGIPI